MGSAWKVQLAILCAGLIAISSSSAETNPNAAIDEHALRAPAAAEATLAKLTEYLVRPWRTERDKVRSIYRWITDRIAYDAAGFVSGNIGDNSAEGVLKSRKAICEGYANLCVELCRRAGITVHLVPGYAKRSDYKPEDDITRFGHAWVAVEFEKRWWLIDCTWGAGALTPEQEFKKHFTEFFYLTPPEKMIFSHFPLEKKWQLLKQPISLEDFKKQPTVSHDLFELGVSVAAVRSAIADRHVSEFVHVFGHPGTNTTIVNVPLAKKLKAGTAYTFVLKSIDYAGFVAFNEKTTRPFRKNGDTFRVTMKPRAGMLVIAARVKQNDEKYHGILEYHVEK